MLNDQHNNEINGRELPAKKIRDHSGSKNPHYNKPHSDASKRAISATLKERYKMIGELVKSGMQNPLTEERIMEIVRQTCSQYLAKHAKPIQNKNDKTIDITL